MKIQNEHNGKTCVIMLVLFLFLRYSVLILKVSVTFLGNGSLFNQTLWSRLQVRR